MAKMNIARTHTKVNGHDYYYFFIFADAFDNSSSKYGEGATETKNL